MSIAPGTTLGRYKIQSLIGAGGMGEVYLALDTQLDREVALKVLAAEIAADAQRLHRFVQEARAASKLKGAHAAHIYDVGEAAGTHFIAMEYVEGRALDQLLAAGAVPVGEVVRLGAQIAEALEEAHARGIVHRDIKPANVIVTPRGQVKVLDFGLAKVAAEGAQADAEAATKVKTSPGVVMGTVNYMPPEQALGERDVDARADIYSLGVVLYELTTGRVPFAADSASKTIDLIVHEPPPAMARFNYDVPPELDVIVRKALRKRRDERYQTAHDMLVDLRSLQADMGVADPHRSLAPGTTSAQTIHTSAPAASAEQPTLMLDSVPPQQQQRTTAGAGADTRPAAARTTETRRLSRALVALVAAALVLLIGAGGYGVYRLARRHEAVAVAPFAALQDMKMTKLPAPGLTRTADISPDGRFLARAVIEGDRQSLRLRQVSATGEQVIVPACECDIFGVTFARDGNSLYYSIQPAPDAVPELRRVSILGGDSQKLVADVASRATLAPDGRRLAFVRARPQANEYALVVASEDGGGERVVSVRKPPQVIRDIAWSPDGRLVACVIYGTDKDGYYTNIEGVAVEGGAAETISAARWRNIGSIAWLADGSGLVLTGRDRASLPGTPEQVWFVAYPGGAARRVTNDTNYYVVAALTADARTLLAGLHGGTSQVWLAPGGDAARARALTANNGERDASVDWLPDGRVVYESEASGNIDIWAVNADGTGARQLTFDQRADLFPAATPDGRYVVFLTNRSVGWSLWRMDADGSNARELVRNVVQARPACAPDSRSVFYTMLDEAGTPGIWQVSIEGGTPARVLDKSVQQVAPSPDGKLLAGFYFDPAKAGPPKLTIFPGAGGAPLRVLDLPRETSADGLRWSPDGQALDFVAARGGVGNVWRVPLAGGPARQLTNWPADYISGFAWSRDGRTLAAVRTQATTELLLIENFR